MVNTSIFSGIDVAGAFWSGIKPVMPSLLLVFGLLIVVNVVALLIDRRAREKKLSLRGERLTKQQALRHLRALSPTEFEQYIALLFSKLGYDARAVGGAGDGGVDVVAVKNGVTHLIQCKKFISSKVAVGDVRNFYGAMNDKLAEGRGIFITTNVFTTEAEKFVEDKPIELWDGDALMKYVALAGEAMVTSQPDVVESAKKSCPRCGGILVSRKGKFGVFLGCANFPKCRYTTPG